MKRLTVALLVALALNVTAVAVQAEVRSAVPADDYDDAQSHPLRIAAYLLHPVGYGLEWIFFRPFHRLVAQPGLASVFGHHEHTDDATIGSR